jgi:hypothetical protein
MSCPNQRLNVLGTQIQIEIQKQGVLMYDSN